MASPLETYVRAHGGTRVLRKILIANNGMAACKAIHSMRQWAFAELGSEKELEFVAMASKDDLEANAEYIRLADSWVEVPGGKNVNNYANVNLIVDIAKRQGVSCVWPGWGHASENPALPKACAEAGITFLGPTAPVMHALGDKIASTILAQSSNVPCIPWNGEGITAEIQADGSIPMEPFKRACLQSYEEALECAKRIGYPVVLKASEGGGGKGIRKCTNDSELKLGWEQVTTEVVGSPIFMMQLCTEARHLEVQLVGDQHGSVVALIGRDCSTQRRFQKIFEEGPPTIADKDDFREAERAAQRLAMSVGYVGAGTVEYLYKPDTKSFYFLELNPRLQVEHPVTEGITGVNVPALQLQIGMGIPLERVPDIRRFYGLADPAGSSKIDFLNDPYVYPKTHVIAARITAENPDDGFRPTSGKVERVRFQSSPSAWGYFSIGVKGAVHEFADSQFGHIFASGPTREHARKALQLALKNILIVGEIRNPTEYLVELAETDEFKNNTIDTAWLDRLIAEKSVKTKFHMQDMIFYAACLRAHFLVKGQRAKILEGIARGHLPLENDVRLLQAFHVEIAHDSVKYNFAIKRTTEDSFSLTIGDTTFETRFREQPDGSLYVKCDDRVAQISGIEEPLGLRLRVEGQATVTFPTIRDPSELRSDFNGKLVRYLHAEGADVADGEAFVELEAMKMIMSLRASSAGKIHHTLTAGAVVAAGDLLATLELADPSKAQRVKPFVGTYQLSTSSELDPPTELKRLITDSISNTGAMSLGEMLCSILRGYGPSPKLGESGAGAVQELFKFEQSGPDANDLGRALKTSQRLVATFLENERFFAGLVGGDETQIVKRFTGSPEELLAKLMAHGALKEAAQMISSVLRSLSASLALDGTLPMLPEELKNSLRELEAFPEVGSYGQLKLLAHQLMRQMDKPLHQRREDVRSLLIDTARKDLPALANTVDIERRMYFGLDIISSFLADEDHSILMKAAELYMLRTYRGYSVDNIDTVESKLVVDHTPAARLHLLWDFLPPGAHCAARKGYAVVLPDVSAYGALQQSWVMPSVPEIAEIHILVARAPPVEDKRPEKQEEAFQEIVSSTTALVRALAPKLDGKKCESLSVMIGHVGRVPSHFHFQRATGWSEVKEFRNMRTTLPHLIELPQLQSEFTMTPLQHGRIFAIDLGTSLDKKAEFIFARGASHLPVGLDTLETALMGDMLASFDAVERANLHQAVDKKHPSAQLFFHYVPQLPNTTERDFTYIQVIFAAAVQRCVAEHGPRVLKLRISRVELKVWLSTSPPTALRLVASSSMGWEATAYQEVLDAFSGRATSYIDLETQESFTAMQMIKPRTEAERSTKHGIARAAGSTYIYDFPLLFRTALTKLWLKSVDVEGVPSQLVVAKELVVENGELVECEQHGRNKIAMVVWRVTLRTPEYPGGREIILIGNDVTVKAGSFGTAEDELFQKASAMARATGLPRVYIACNSGARLGTVEELKPLVKIAWADEGDLLKGFDYLYLKDDDLAKLPSDTVRSHPVTVGGEVRHVLDAIMGLSMPSTKGGIGVESLQGSGLIAGETSRAYEETFTLSYATGRSVGIGAYLNRLGQRNIQMVQGPMILTGYQALNKLLGKQVYTTQDQLGGPHIMVPNGVTHELVKNDQDGVEAILRWLSYVPETARALPPVLKSRDPATRLVRFAPSRTPYDPRHMLAGAMVEGEWQPGFCDEGSFREYMEGWGKTVVVGRGRLGGLPIGIVAVETRAVERHIPADPADVNSHDIHEPQAGQVWYPDSAYKTAQAIRDFNRGENLPLVIFANWRGFSGGTRDMFAEVLKYGAMIVDALVDYKHPVTIYIPPNGELRGGAWVVLDPKINPEQMEMFADVDARGGILEPPAAAEIVFKQDRHVLEMMHRCDETLRQLDEQRASGGNVAEQIMARERLLLPMYRQVAVTYCDLHDRSGRMKGLGAVREELHWAESREYLHWRIRRRMQVNGVARRLTDAVPGMSHEQAVAVVDDIVRSATEAAGAGAEDAAVATWLETNAAKIEARIEEERVRATQERIYSLVSSLPAAQREQVLRDLVGFARVAAASSA